MCVCCVRSCVRSLTYSSQLSTNTVTAVSSLSWALSIFPPMPRMPLWASNAAPCPVSLVVLARAIRNLSAAVVTTLCVLSISVRLPPLTRLPAGRDDQSRLHSYRRRWTLGRTWSSLRDACVCILYDFAAICIMTHLEHIVLYPFMPWITTMLRPFLHSAALHEPYRIQQVNATVMQFGWR